MRPRLPILALAALCLLAAGCRSRPGSAAALDPNLDFRLPALGGGELGPADYAGQVLVLEFWATWCTPCRAQATILEHLHAEYAPRGVAFLAVDLGEPEAKVRAFVDKSPFPYPVVYDADDEVSARLGIFALPTVAVIDATGAVVFFESGLSTAPMLRQALDQALGGPVGL